MAKIYGQIEYAQLHNLTAAPSAGKKGLIYWDTVLLKSFIDDGTSVLALLRNDTKCVFGTSGTAASNIRFHRGAAAVLQFVLGSDATAEASLSTSLAQISAKHENYTVGTRPANGNAGRVIWVSDATTLQVDSGSAWIPVGGGGGGGSLLWVTDETNSAEEFTEFSQRVYKFVSALAQTIRTRIVVPTSYVAGFPISVKIGLYSPSSSNTILLSATSYLIAKNSSAVNSTTNSRTTTNTALTNTVANQYRQATLDVTSSTGTINSVAVAAGDIIEVVVTRGSDSDTADIRFMPYATEVTFT